MNATKHDCFEALHKSPADIVVVHLSSLGPQERALGAMLISMPTVFACSRNPIDVRWFGCAMLIQNLDSLRQNCFVRFIQFCDSSAGRLVFRGMII